MHWEARILCKRWSRHENVAPARSVCCHHDFGPRSPGRTPALPCRHTAAHGCGGLSRPTQSCWSPCASALAQTSIPSSSSSPTNPFAKKAASNGASRASINAGHKKRRSSIPRSMPMPWQPMTTRVRSIGSGWRSGRKDRNHSSFTITNVRALKPLASSLTSISCLPGLRMAKV